MYLYIMNQPPPRPPYFDFSGSTIYEQYKIISLEIVSLNEKWEIVDSEKPGSDAWFLITWWLSGVLNLNSEDIQVKIKIKRDSTLTMVTNGEVWNTVGFCTNGPVLINKRPYTAPPCKAIVQKHIKQYLDKFLSTFS